MMETFFASSRRGTAMKRRSTDAIVLLILWRSFLLSTSGNRFVSAFTLSTPISVLPQRHLQQQRQLNHHPNFPLVVLYLKPGTCLHRTRSALAASRISNQNIPLNDSTPTATSTSTPPFWLDSSDNVYCNATHVECTIRGNPQPLLRHRTARRGRFTYNPSKGSQLSFANVLTESLQLSIPLLEQTDGSLVPVTHFGSQLVSLQLDFFLQRPKSHFRNNQRHNPLKASAPHTKLSVDVDNLAKFVLDSLNSVLYQDDAQVVELCCQKYYHEEDQCLGKTVLRAKVVTRE